MRFVAKAMKTCTPEQICASLLAKLADWAETEWDGVFGYAVGTPERRVVELMAERLEQAAFRNRATLCISIIDDPNRSILLVRRPRMGR